METACLLTSAPFFAHPDIYPQLTNQTGNYSFGIEVHKGINLIYRWIEGQERSWGAEDNTQETFSDTSRYIGNAGSPQMQFLEYSDYPY